MSLPVPGHARWYSSHELIQVSTWEDLCRRYAAGIGTRHLAAGGACALQHWSGRFVRVLLDHWLRTGALLDTDHDRCWAWIDEDAATRTVTLGSRVAVADAAPSLVVAALLDHVSAFVPAVREVSRITSKLAYGSVATSCAGFLGRAHRRVGHDQRASLRVLADMIMSDERWPSTTLVTLIDIDPPDGRRLTHERHTCCLIRLGDHDPCATCRDLDADERFSRLMRAATNAPDDPPLVLADSIRAWAGAGSSA